MTPEEIGPRLVELVGTGEAGVSVGGRHARACVDVPPARWVAAATLARDDAELGLTFFDWLTGVDEGEAGFGIVAHLWSVPRRHGALLRTRVPRADAHLDSLAGVFPGAVWHERETFEMFGVVFDGHPDLKKLLLPDEFEGNPLRKDFVLVARAAKPWPGAKEPGESDSGAPSRRRIRPPGVPEPAEWGPNAGAAAEEAPARAAGERPSRERPIRERPTGERPARAARERPARQTPPAEQAPSAEQTPSPGEAPAPPEGETPPPTEGGER